jgi:5-formyltetrahydrofolate cyclo-ligase
VALALRDQIVETGRIPMSEHDWTVDIIVTPDELLQKPGKICEQSYDV